MLSKQLIRVFFAGLVASLLMLAFFFMLPALGLNQLNVFGVLSTFSSSEFRSIEPLEVLVLGVFVFPLLYAKLLYESLPGRPWRKGLTWGLILWALRGAIVMPIMGEGFFSISASHPLENIIATLVGHAIYGLILGSLIGDLDAHPPRKVTPKTYAGTRR